MRPWLFPLTPGGRHGRDRLILSQATCPGFRRVGRGPASLDGGRSSRSTLTAFASFGELLLELGNPILVARTLAPERSSLGHSQIYKRK